MQIKWTLENFDKYHEYSTSVIYITPLIITFEKVINAESFLIIFIKLVRFTRKRCCQVIAAERTRMLQKGLTLQNVFIWGHYWEKFCNRDNMNTALLEKCVPKESIPNHFKQTWVQHLYVLSKVQNFASLRPYNHQIYIDEVSYPLCMTLQYEEVEKGSTTKKPSKVWYHLLLTSADIFVKIVLRKGHVWWPWNRKN